MTDYDTDAVAEAVGTPRSFDDWMVVARGLAAGQRWAKDEAGAGHLQGLEYGRAMSLWLKEHPSFGCYSEAECWAMLRCLERLEEIDAWRARQPASEHAQLNHPAKVLAGFLAGDVPVNPRDERINKLEQKVAELRDEIARLRARRDCF